MDELRDALVELTRPEQIAVVKISGHLRPGRLRRWLSGACDRMGRLELPAWTRADLEYATGALGRLLVHAAANELWRIHRLADALRDLCIAELAARDEVLHARQ